MDQESKLSVRDVDGFKIRLGFKNHSLHVDPVSFLVCKTTFFILLSSFEIEEKDADEEV